MKVYVVLSEYPCDYGIHAVFSTMEMAEKYRSKQSFANPKIYEYEVDPCVNYGLCVWASYGKYERYEPLCSTKTIEERLEGGEINAENAFLVFPTEEYYGNNSKAAEKIARKAWAKYKYEHNIT